MRGFTGKIFFFLLAGCLILATAVKAADMDKYTGKAKGHGGAVEVILVPDDLKWQDAPNALPPGAKLAVLEGNPMAKGPYTMRLKLPAGYKIPPHWHNGPEHVTVISGDFNLGKGDTFDESKGTNLPQGSFFMMKPKSHHFAWTGGETVLQLHGIGPWAITYVNPADDPRKK